MDIKPIRTAKDHAWALRESRASGARPSPALRRATASRSYPHWGDAYEREHFEIPAPDPIEAIRFRMEQEGLTNNDLLPIFKTRARVSEVMGRRRRLNLTMIRRLHERAGDSHRVLGAELQAEGAGRRQAGCVEAG